MTEKMKARKRCWRKRRRIWNAPDVLLVDGGTGHVNAVRSVLEELDLTFPYMEW